ncbi:hypothetical protein BKH46_08735 [Helicobacter sp. 12S02634-8]|uniref:Dna2/Cas4 domain-containing protein n=1 Tax=Helicobacter sp. 12S02634-8 TaxID=1476199 RepID=UPI000BC3B19C|nr:Dna2/Cas4 domain-containing protein [Helicobacter sp. 12S02634-8]PAF46154.1 hypothetical protein BKH46_08735 [Helicobacter sp. 12S02634-8]
MKINDKFIEFMISGIKKQQAQDTSLGDRSRYIGASDVGQCPRKCYLGKIHKVESDTKGILAQTRGHLSESILEEGLKGQNIKYRSQVEVAGKNQPWLKAHLDFLIESGGESVVIECKNTKNSLDTPYESWVLQLQTQMGLMRENGIEVKRGIIAVLLIAEDRLIAFEYDFDPLLYEVAIKKASLVWDSLQSGVEPQAETSFLCPYCPFKDTCPKQAKDGEELPKEFIEKIEKLKKIQESEKVAKGMKQEITDHLKAMNIKFAKAGEYKVSLTWYSGRDKIDTSKIPQDLLAEITTKGDPYSVLRIG